MVVVGGGSSFLEAKDGKQALETLRENWVDTVIIEGSQEKISQFLEQGASGYVTKPFTPEQIRDRPIIW